MKRGVTDRGPAARFLTAAEVAEELACSANAVYDAITRGDLPALKYGRLVRIKRTDLDAFIAAHTTGNGGSGRRR